MRVILHRVCLGLAAAVLLIAGCRTYGNQSSRNLLLQSINETVSQVEREGAVWQQDAEKLAGASALNPQLQLFADQALALVQQHGELVDRLQSLGTEVARSSLVTDNPGARWIGPDRYRKLHRVYGSMVTERQQLINQRAVLARDLETVLGLTAPSQMQEKGRYQIVPHHYHQFGRAPNLTDVLAQLGRAVVQ